MAVPDIGNQLTTILASGDWAGAQAAIEQALAELNRYLYYDGVQHPTAFKLLQGTYSIPVTVTLRAGEPIAAGKAVMMKSDGKAWLADASLLANANRTIGVSATHCYAANNNVDVMVVGLLMNFSMTMVPGSIYYVGANGNLVTSDTGLAFSQRVGYAINPNMILVCLYPIPVTRTIASGITSNTAMCGEAIDSLLCVRFDPTDHLLYRHDPESDGASSNVVGVSITSSSDSGQYVEYVSHGLISGNGRGFISNARYFAGPLGTLVTSVPADGVLQLIGIGGPNDTLLVVNRPPIVRKAA